MSQAQFARVISEFGQSLGIPDLAPNDYGAVTLRADGSTEFHVIVNPEGDQVTAFVELGELDDEINPAVIRALLQANYFWTGTGGGTLGLQPETNVVILAQRFAVASLTAAELEQVMKRFLEFVDRGLTGFEPEAESSPNPGAPPVRV